MKLAKAHWATRPRDILGRKRAEIRVIYRLRGGLVVGKQEKAVSVFDRWMTAPCREIVLDVNTRRRVDVRCPDCVPPEGEVSG